MDASPGEKAAAPPPTVDDYLRDIERRHPFAYAKINHGLWEALIGFERARATGATASPDLSSYFASGFHEELRTLVRGAGAMPGDVRLAVSTHAFPNDDRLTGFPVEPEADIRRVMDEFVGGAPLTADAMLWKDAVIEGRLPELCRLLRARDVVLVGPSWLQHFGAFAGLERFRFIAINESKALLRRRQTADEIRAAHRADDRPVYLVQAGPLSVWLILTLQQELANATFLDLGTVLDLCSVSRSILRVWTRRYRDEIASTIRAINPAWPDDARAYEGATSPGERRTIWRRFSGGIMPELAAIAGLPERSSGLGNFDRPSLSASGRMRYVEDKPIDWERVGEILELSRRANHWTNFGPVSQALERSLEFALGLPPDRAVVVCSSATAGLTALAGLHAVKRGRPLRWVVSAYTFAVQRTGAFADSIVVDCDEQGLIDVAAVKRLPKNRWDGMIVTNLFGTLESPGRFAKFCRKRGKALIVDSAAALLGPNRSASGGPVEAVSFHHTKPWGVGEGGCVIVDRADVPLVRSALNFGMAGPDALKPFAGNGKISELACALILDRLERLPSWSSFYRGQCLRIAKLCRHAGLPLLAQIPDRAILAALPVLAARPIDPSQVADWPFDAGKYYPPLDRGCPKAAGIFSRIVNIPCHAGMAGVPNDAIEAVLRDLATPKPSGVVARLVAFAKGPDAARRRFGSSHP